MTAADALLITAWNDRPSAGRGWPVLCGAVLLGAVVLLRQALSLRLQAALLHRLDGTLTALRKSMVRDQILAGTGLHGGATIDKS